MLLQITVYMVLHFIFRNKNIHEHIFLPFLLIFHVLNLSVGNTDICIYFCELPSYNCKHLKKCSPEKLQQLFKHEFLNLMQEFERIFLAQIICFLSYIYVFQSKSCVFSLKTFCGLISANFNIDFYYDILLSLICLFSLSSFF